MLGAKKIDPKTSYSNEFCYEIQWIHILENMTDGFKTFCVIQMNSQETLRLPTEEAENEKVRGTAHTVCHNTTELSCLSSVSDLTLLKTSLS